MAASQRRAQALSLPRTTATSFESSSHLPYLEMDITSFESLPNVVDCQRRPSFESSASASDLDIFSAQSAESTSPATPATSGAWATVHPGQYMKSDNGGPDISTILSSSVTAHDSAFWQLPQQDDGWVPFFEHLEAEPDPTLPMEFAVTPDLTCHKVLSNPAMNPSLSRAIFNETLQGDTIAAWQASAMVTPPRTIAPGHDIRCEPETSSVVKSDPTTPGTGDTPPTSWRYSTMMTPSHNGSDSKSYLGSNTSPASKVSLTTPLRSNCCALDDMSSSPLSFSAHILPSQRDIEEIPYMMYPTHLDLSAEDMKRIKGSTSRLSRRHYARKGARASTRQAKPTSSKSGIDCPEIIPQNEFACKYPNCIDKTTGKQKRFKRQEHKKRHEKTVHEKTNHNQYGCWVPDCKTKPFSRTDNLKSHLRKTHGKKSVAARNRYVATQDEASPYYDPEYVGLLTDEGLPVYDGR